MLFKFSHLGSGFRQQAPNNGPQSTWRHAIAGLALALTALLGAGAAHATELGMGWLEIAGTRLLLAPESQTVPFDTPTIVTTQLTGWEPPSGMIPAGLRVLGDFSGPEITGTLVLETVPGQPFRIPRLRLKGEYRLDDVRLVEDGQVLLAAEPPTAVITVTQVLVTRVTSRPLTLDEIRSQGLVIDDDSFQALNLTFAFGVDGEEVSFDVPLVYRLYGPDGAWGPSIENLQFPTPSFGGGSSPSRFKPPQIIPFEVEIDHQEPPEIPHGGCQPVNGECRKSYPPGPPMVGVILFPTDISLLHQFFSVVLMVQNGAPEGDVLTLRDLTARIALPTALRQAATEPPTPLGEPVPVRVPGPDGELGTADDVSFVVAQASGDAEFLLEGLSEGTHVVDFQIEGLLEGLPTGLQRVTGRARGAVVVRDPTLAVTITHPNVVRNDEAYSLFLTVANLGTAPVNLLSLKLPASKLSGTSVLGANEQMIDELLPGDSQAVEFRLLSQRTGRVVASSAKSGSSVSPDFEFSVGVGNSIPLSPESLALPKTTESLPPQLLRPALALAGLGHSLSTAPPALTSSLPRVAQQAVHERIYRLAQAGRHLSLGEEPFETAATLALEWNGARDADWEWDQLRRSVAHGATLATAIGAIFDAAEPSPEAVFERFARAAHYLAPRAALASGAELSLRSLTSGQRLAGTGALGAPGRVRELPFAELYPLTGAELAVLAVPEAGGYEVRLASPTGGAADLHLLAGEEDGALRLVHFENVALAAGAAAWVALTAEATGFSLSIDDDGDGVAERQLAGTVELLAPRPFAALAAVQNAEIDPSGHVVEVLLSADVDLASLLPRDPAHFVVPGKVSNGGLIPAEVSIATGPLGQPGVENPFAGLQSSRIVRVVFDNPLSPYAQHDLTVSDLASVVGETLGVQVVPVTTTVSQPGAIVEGTVIGSDGQPVPDAEVKLIEKDRSGVGNDTLCLDHPTAALRTDAAGRFRFDYVRQSDCGDTFMLTARHPDEPKWGTAKGRVRLAGETQQLDVVMIGRGRVHGRVLYEDGTVPAGLGVILQNPVFQDVRLAHVDSQGYYNAEDVMVGTVSIAATDDAGQAAYATVELAQAGAVVEHDLTIIRQPDAPTAELRGNVFELDGTTPVANAYVALYVGGHLIGTRSSAAGGSFDFGVVPAGIAELEAFDGETGRSGARLFLELLADQVETATLLLRDDRGSVQGHVYRQSPAGALTPVVGAVVWANGLAVNTTTDSGGYYRLDDLLAGNLTVHAADLARGETASAQVTITTAGGLVDRDLYFVDALPDGGITGEVLGYDGQPVAGAVVHLAGGYYSTNWHHQASTNSQGRFVIPDLAPGSYGVHALRGQDGAIGFVTVRFQGDTPFVSVRFRKGTIRGRTLETNTDGQPVGVISQIVYRTVEVVDEWGLVAVPPDFTTILTNADGTFELDDVLVGPYEIFIYNAFHGEKRIKGSLEIDGQVAEHEIVFAQNGAIRGVVYDHDGTTPVAGATLDIRGAGFSQYDLVSDEQGRFSFAAVPPGSYQVEAHWESGLIFRKAIVGARLRGFGDELDVEVVLQKQGAVVGWVETSNGEPVPGAVVTLAERGYPWRRIVHNADAEGNYAFENVFAGDVTVSAQAPTLGGLGGKATAALTDEAQQLTIPIVLEDVGELVGRVLGAGAGEVVSGAQVALYRTGFFDAATSDAEGAFRFRLLPLGFYQVKVFDPATGRRGVSAWLEVTENGQVVEGDVMLESRGVVAGHLYDSPSNTPVPGNVVSLRSEGLAWFTTYASTELDGGFEFGGIPEGAFTLDAVGPDRRRRAHARGTLAEEDQQVTVDLYLEAISRVSGQVLAPPGAPAGLFPNVNLRLLDNGLTVDATLENPFELFGILPRRSHALAADEIGGLHRGYSRLPAQFEDGVDLTADVRMEAIGSVLVSVFDGSGNPVPGADVHVGNYQSIGPNAVFPSFSSFAGSTGADHQITFADVREGAVTAWAQHPTNGLRGSTVGTLALEGQQIELTIALQPSGVVRGQALLADGATLAAGAVVALASGSRSYVATADAEGRFEFAAVPTGSYTLTIQESFGPGTIERLGNLAVNGENDDFGTLVLDDQNPRVLAIAPASGSRDLPVSSVVTVDFSEPIDTARQTSAWLKLRRLGTSGSIAFTTAWSADATRATLTPTAPLASATAYDVVVGTEVRDRAGRRLDWQAYSTFTTADVIRPAVIDVVPRNGQTQVAVDTQILITFSEPVTLGSLSGAALELFDLTAGAAMTTTFQLLPGERVVRLTPVLGLAADHQYRITVQAVQDGAGNTMAAPMVSTFWTPDETLPTLSWTAPAAGAVFTAGEAVAAQVEASDNRGVAHVSFAVGEWLFTDTQAPYAQTFPAPWVASASTVEIVATAVDSFGNATAVTRTISVEPRQNASPPVAGFSCWRDGDWVVPGVPYQLGFSIQDDEAVESYRLAVDGTEIELHAPVGLALVSSAFAWTPPAGALPGESFVVRLETRDFAGNTAAQEIALRVPPAVLRGDQTLPASLAGQVVYLADGRFTAASALALESLVLIEGATLTAGSSGTVTVSTSGELRVQCGATIDVTALGYAGGGAGHVTGHAPAWVGEAPVRTGGSHGGAGADAAGAASAAGTYDSVYQPHLGGGGSGAAESDGNPGGPRGGGAVALEAGALVLEGEILAVGGKSGSGLNGGGGGGSVFIAAGSLTGRGQIDASGGEGAGGSCGSSVQFTGWAGGGGRVGLDVGSFAGFDPIAQARAWGGRQKNCFDSFHWAGPGTVWVKTAQDLYGKLRVDSGVEEEGETVPVTVLPELGSGAVADFAPAGADGWVSAASPFRSRWLGAWMELSDTASVVLGIFRVVALDASGRALLEGAGTVTEAVSWRGEYRFDAIDLVRGAGLAAADAITGARVVIAADAQLSAEVTASELVIESGVTVTPAAGGELHFHVGGTMTLEPGAVIDVSGLGFAAASSSHLDGHAPAGVDPAKTDAGGSHGGAGSLGYDAGPVGESYDSVYRPELGGGGGGLSQPDATLTVGAGGGVVTIEAGELVLDGQILARAETGRHPLGAGAGGTVRIATGTLHGAGLIDVAGGKATPGVCGGPNPYPPTAGAGGGGRVALEVGTFAGFDPALQVFAQGGERERCNFTLGWGAAGTIFVKQPADVYGSLRVDQEIATAEPVVTTQLPSLGRGTVGAIVVDADDPTALWIEPADPMARFGVGVWGMWMRIGDLAAGSDFRVIAESIDRRRVLLEGAAGQVAIGDAYLGVYKFDSVTVTGKAQLRFRDAEEVATLDVAAGSSVTVLDLEPPALTLTAPAVGTVVTSGDMLAVSAVASDNVGVVEVRFALGADTFVDPQAPYAWNASAPTVTATTSLDLVVEAVDADGNLTSITRLIQVEPLPLGNPPMVAVLPATCPADGDLVAAGRPVTLHFTATDDEAVESYRLLVDGVEQPAVATNAASVTASLGWTVPAGAAPGTVYTLRVAARDFAGATGLSQPIVLRVLSGSYLTGTQTLTAALDGQSLVLASGTFTVAEPLALAGLVALDGAVILAASSGLPLDLAVGGTLDLQCGSAIDMTARGYRGGDTTHEAGDAPAGSPPAGKGAGGCHLGRGSQGSYTAVPCEGYDSVYWPMQSGGGGGRGSSTSVWGTSGGGVVGIAAAEVVLDGEIRARGGHADLGSWKGYWRGTGAGGAVTIVAGSMHGVGTIDSSGGDYYPTGASDYGGLGGGGVVALHVDDLTGFDVGAQARSRGGRRFNTSGAVVATSAPGAVYFKDASSVYGSLHVDTGGLVAGTLTVLSALGSGAVVALETDGADAWLSAAAAFKPHWLGTWVTLTDAAGAELGTYEVVDRDATGRVLLAGAAGATAATYRGEYRFDAIEAGNGARLSASDALTGGDVELSGDVRIPPVLTASNLTLRAGAKVVPVVGGSLALAVDGTLTIESGAMLSTTGLGYRGGDGTYETGAAPAGVQPAGRGAGGCHTGRGSRGNYTVPDCGFFDSVYQPALAGGGGGRGSNSTSTYWGGYGGGVIQVVAGEIVLDGVIEANGANLIGNWRGAGAGGAVVLRAQALSGQGQVTATGGNYQKFSVDFGGVGGGGAVALDVDDLSGFDVAAQVSASSGKLLNTNGTLAGYGSAGTTYVVDSASTYGDLIVDFGDFYSTSLPVWQTVTPVLGTGNVAALQAEGADAWLTASAALPAHWKGAWILLRDVGGTTLGTFRVLDVDAAGRLLVEGAGAVTDATSFVGQYRFDTVEVRRGAKLKIDDLYVIDTIVVDPQSQLTLPPAP